MELYLNTTDRVLLIIVTVLLSLFFLLACIAIGMVIRILASVKRVIKSAENVVDSVESAAEVLKESTGQAAIFKLLKNIIDLSHTKKK